MIELNKPYSAEELCKNLFGISYNSFRKKHIKERYLKQLSECYEWKKEKSKYILTAEKKEYKPIPKKSELIYENIYLPKVVDNVGDGKWSTGTGVAVEIYETNYDFIKYQLKHELSTTYSYVLTALKNNYNVSAKQYAKGYRKGYYGEGPDFMTKEEIAEWNKLKESEYANVGKKILELTEDWMGKGYSAEEFKNNVSLIASQSFAGILMEWIAEKGYIPVLLNYFEPREIGIDFVEEDNYEW